MSPIRITPTVPVQICVGERILTVEPNNGYFDAERMVSILPEGKSADFTVKVNGFSNAPGGMLTSQRLSPGNNLDEIALTTPEDSELNGELGLSEVTIDGVIYTATNPSQK